MRPLTWRSIVHALAVAAAIVSFAMAAQAAEVLFPQPLHVIRKIEDPVSHTTTTVHEYCAGNEIVTVNGDRVAIVDYDKQQMTEIDRAAGTYSVTRFDDVVKAIPVAAGQSSGPAVAANGTPRERWRATPMGARAGASGRSVEVHELIAQEDDPTAAKIKIELALDRRVLLSRRAVEVLIGASFPNPKRDEHDAILRASAGSDRGPKQPTANAATAAPADRTYALPVEQNTTIELDDQRLTLRNTILDVRSELAPAGVKSIPPGARQVESKAVRMVREMRELDNIPAPPSKQQ
ncbi:MAG: hypothetical protein ACLGH0_01775 [Thermoanaerobaculia bacterium]